MEAAKIELIQDYLNKAFYLIDEIQEVRDSCFISLICIDLPINYPLVYKLNKILRRIGKIDKLDLLIESGGGDIDATAKINSILKKRCKEFTAIVPFAAKSAATFLALSADNLIICKSGELGPVDPQVRHPTADIWIPAHSIKEALEFVEETEDPLVKLSMADKLDPFLMGAYMDATKAAEQYMEEVLDTLPDEKKENAIHTFTGKYRSHGYPIDEELCNKIGVITEKIEEDLEEKICDLHEIYFDLAFRLKFEDGVLIIQSENLYEIEIDGENISSELDIEMIKETEEDS
ncbi:MAG: hypothetical protein CW694_02665 [Candidatus Syntrophoarchaeum sp. WYZ-LMO15]|nr:MAG: hypothetical protein CW694_02665 [Candidatus Syntrophoarchaeum sp. WYZ-LMO15]